MARIRTIKPEYWTSEQVLSCSRDARLLFIGLWNFADDLGRHRASSLQLKAEVFGGDDTCSVCEITMWIDELIANELVLEYAVDESKYWQVTGWDHQRIDRPKTSRIPPPPSPKNTRKKPAQKTSKPSSNNRGGVVDSSSNNPRHVDESSTTNRRALDEGSTLEGKGRDLKPKRARRAARPPRRAGADVGADVRTDARAGLRARARGAPLSLSGIEEIPEEWAQWVESELCNGNGGGEWLENEAGKFIDYYQSKGEPRVDWYACWRKWFRHAAERRRA